MWEAGLTEMRERLVNCRRENFRLLKTKHKKEEWGVWLVHNSHWFTECTDREKVVDMVTGSGSEALWDLVVQVLGDMQRGMGGHWDEAHGIAMDDWISLPSPPWYGLLAATPGDEVQSGPVRGE